MELFGESLVLTEFPQREDLSGLGMTDWGAYAIPLATKLNYRNTFYHAEPRLDILAPPREWERSVDFIISTDVFEHIPPPVSVGFESLARLLKPTGVVIFSVPFHETNATKEHFPELNKFEIIWEGGRRLLKNVTRDDREQVFDNLVFHGGEGATLEMRLFGLPSLVDEFRRVGLEKVKVYWDSYPDFGIYWDSPNGAPVAARFA